MSMSSIDLKEIFPMLIPVIALQFGLQIFCLINLIRRRKVRYNSKLLWGAVILLLGMIGSVAYLVMRGDEE